jgi:hypothetical protein
MSGKSKRNLPRGRHGETCACCCRPLSDGEEIVLTGQDGTQHRQCQGCRQPFRQGQEIQTVHGYDSRGELLKWPMHLGCAVHGWMVHGPGSN